jgi:hypothetical protein
MRLSFLFVARLTFSIGVIIILVMQGPKLLFRIIILPYIIFRDLFADVIVGVADAVGSGGLDEFPYSPLVVLKKCPKGQQTCVSIFNMIFPLQNVHPELSLT